jgi:Sec-independent protein translocase protein TatA
MKLIILIILFFTNQLNAAVPTTTSIEEMRQKMLQTRQEMQQLFKPEEIQKQAAQLSKEAQPVKSNNEEDLYGLLLESFNNRDRDNDDLSKDLALIAAANSVKNLKQQDNELSLEIITQVPEQKYIVKHCQSANKPFNKCFKYLHDIKLKTLPAEYREIEQFRCKLDFSQIAGIEGDFAYHPHHPSKIYFRHNYTTISLPVFSLESTNRKWPINFWYVKSGWVNDEGGWFVERYPGNPLTLDDSINDQRCPTKYRKPFIAKELVRPEKQVIEKIIYQDNCDFLKNQPQCSLLSERCLEQGVKEIKGINVEQCLKYELNYNCDFAETEDQSCQALKRDPHCTHIEAKCISQQDGFCSKYQHSYHCFSEDDIVQQKDEFSANILCSDGQCDLSDEQLNDELGPVMAEMSFAGEIVKDHQGEQINIFKGKAEQCRKNNLIGNFANCCNHKKSGWGSHLNLAKCKIEQRVLMDKFNQGLCYFAGSHQEKSGPFGVMKKTYNNYCCFNSKLQKIIQQNAKQQLGINATDCSGINLAQLKNIDFSTIDVSEIASDLMGNYKRLDQQKIQKTIAEQFGQQTRRLK